MNTARLAQSKYVVALMAFCLLLSAPVTAEKIYKTVHKDGTISYSDKPSPGSIEVDFASNTTTVVQNPNLKTKPIITIKKKQKVAHTLSVTSPAEEATIRNTTGNVTINAVLQPKEPGHYELSLQDNKLRSTSGIFQVEGLNRGEYSYQITFVGASGKVIASSDERRFFVHKPSVLITPQNKNK